MSLHGQSELSRKQVRILGHELVIHYGFEDPKGALEAQKSA